MKRTVAVTCIAALAVSLAGCKTEVQSENCAGKDKTVTNKYIDESGKPTLSISCGSGVGDRMYVVWNKDDDRDAYDGYAVGDPYP